MVGLSFRGLCIFCFLYTVLPASTWAQVLIPGSNPWERDLMIRSSNDGNSFGPERLFSRASGVPSIVRDQRGRLIAALQWFPQNDPANWDRVAVKISQDGGNTWSEPQPIRVQDFPEGFSRPFDPTLAVLDDGRIRIYFSSNPNGRQTLEAGVATFSAISNDAGSDPERAYFDYPQHSLCPFHALGPQSAGRREESLSKQQIAIHALAHKLLYAIIERFQQGEGVQIINSLRSRNYSPAECSPFFQKRLHLDRVQGKAMEELVCIKVQNINAGAQDKGPVRISTTMQAGQRVLFMDSGHRGLYGIDNLFARDIDEC
jgi:hypothetical protein